MSSRINKLLTSLQESTEPILVKIKELPNVSIETSSVVYLEVQLVQKNSELTKFPIYLTSQAGSQLYLDNIQLDQEIYLNKYVVSNLVTENLKRGKLFLIVNDISNKN